MASNDPGPPDGDQQHADGGPQRRKPAKRSHRAFVEEPLYLLPAHYTLLQDSTYELMRGLAGLSTAVEDDPLYFDQLLAAAVNVKHAFDLGRMDVINGTIRPRNTSLCHECITTVSSVWRSGPEGPRTLCNACGLRFYKQSQRRALEARRREMRDASGAADPATAAAAAGAASAAGAAATQAAISPEASQPGSAHLDGDDGDATMGDAGAPAGPPRVVSPSPAPTRPSIANLCDMTRGPSAPFIPSIRNILASPSQTPEPQAGRCGDRDNSSDAE
ncbi:hypothetical protein H4R18_005634 [Coemansia javaensis]|uniref:GATA-type domain-containing protein n=1 Tax=Coemansia javaensis TaxID=2761396 RepID=A0A9W8LF97_9FUNG|nr:hypothetical protein H4R18_005634 [Coemansia javaensis]